MNVVEQALRRITADLASRGQGWALVGGFAVSARAEPRFTRDVDVAVAVPDDGAAEEIEILPDLTIPVAQTGHLIAVKLLARDDLTRPQDLADLRALLDVSTPADLAVTREAIGLIAERGFDRGRDLTAALAELVG
jgi:hypothetical protein